MLRARLFAPLTMLAVAGCNRTSRPVMKTAVEMGDPAITTQLVSGFYNVEANKWRWTARQFCITFPGSPKTETRALTLHLYIPAEQMQKQGQLTLSADVNGSALPPEVFREGGMHTYTRTVPAPALDSNVVPVVFSLDKAAPGTGKETRELGVVVTDAKLERI